MTPTNAIETIVSYMDYGFSRFPANVRHVLGTCGLKQYRTAIKQCAAAPGLANPDRLVQECRRQRRNFKNNQYQLKSRKQIKATPSASSVEPMAAIMARTKLACMTTRPTQTNHIRTFARRPLRITKHKRSVNNPGKNTACVQTYILEINTVHSIASEFTTAH